jgi:ribosomal protein L37E
MVNAMSNISRLKRLEEKSAGDTCVACGWPLPSDQKPPAEWMRAHWTKIDEQDDAEPTPVHIACMKCGRSERFGVMTFDGQKS